MNYLLFIDEAVEDELNEATEYYEKLQEGLGTRLYDDFDDTLDYIRKAPLGFQVEIENFRCIQLARFPYVIVYKVEATTIVVYRFINARKKPEKRYKKK